MKAIATAASATIPPTRSRRRTGGVNVSRALIASAVAATTKNASVSHAHSANPRGKSAVSTTIATTATTNSRTRASTGPGRLFAMALLHPRARPRRRVAQHGVLCIEVRLERFQLLDRARVPDGDQRV